jgi:hypothetical protein
MSAGLATVSGDGEGLPQVFGAGVPDVGVENRDGAGTDLPAVVEIVVVVAPAIGDESDRIDAERVREEYGSGKVKRLRADHRVFDAENRRRPRHAVEGSETGVVEKDVPGGNAPFPKPPRHRGDLIVRGRAVITGDQYFSNLVFPIEGEGRFEPVGQYRGRPTIAVHLGPKHDRRVPLRCISRGIENLIPGGDDDDEIEQYREKNERQDEQMLPSRECRPQRASICPHPTRSAYRDALPPCCNRPQLSRDARTEPGDPAATIPCCR